MKYSEFKEWLDKNNYSYKENDETMIIDNNLLINKKDSSGIGVYYLVPDYNLIIQGLAFRKSLIEEREIEKWKN